jgi:exonuclease SbcC
MRLTKFSADIFAGINDRSYQFEEGLNILLGANEAGKSTIINAIYASLFIQPQIKLNTSEGKEFEANYLPYPHGDYAEAELSFEAEGEEYKLYKKWSNSNYGGYLQLPDGARVESTNKIKEIKADIFPYGKSTYKNIVFSRQKDLKSTIQNINAENNPELVSTVSSFLRRAVMELDGVPIDKFKNKLDAEIEDLTKRWDIKSMSIENKNRGINNPYKIGTGKIYDCYIEKGLLAEQIAEAKRNEKLYRDLSSAIKELKEDENNLSAKIESLEEIEEDMNKSYELEHEIKDIDKDLKNLNEAAENWPKLKSKLEKLNKEKKNLKDELTERKAEKSNAEKYQQKIEIENKLKKIEEYKKEINDLAEQIGKIARVTEEKISELEKYKEAIDKSEAGLKAGKLKAKINFSADDNIKFTAGMDEEKEVSSADILEADGYIRIITEHIDIEIESAEIDFSDLQKKYSLNKEKYEELLAEFEVENLSGARAKLNNLKDLKNSKDQAENRIREILDGDKIEDLKEKSAQFVDLEKPRELKKIEAELEELNNQLNEVQSGIAVKEDNLDKLKKDYSSLEELKSLIEKKRKAKTELNNEADKLAELPEAYADVKAFKKDLRDKRHKKDEIATLLREKLQEVKTLENNLPERSTREMKAELEELETEFERLVKRAENLKIIKETFLNKLEEMDQNSFQPLIETFSDNLKRLTAGKYKVGLIDDHFNVMLEADNKKKLPANLDLLSFGTYDGAALALRFALFDNLFRDHGGFIILDDCLVNLDPERRKKAVELINEFQKNYQVIYTTCSPARAEELDGHLIEV